MSSDKMSDKLKEESDIGSEAHGLSEGPEVRRKGPEVVSMQVPTSQLASEGYLASLPEDTPGDELGLSTRMTNLTMSSLEKFAPLGKIGEHLCAFHFYAHDMTRQVVAHHYCSHRNEEVRQCVIYDSPRRDARLIGVEYMISERLFKELPEEEKKYWHSHKFEVESGQLYAPHTPAMAENIAMQKVVFTYGKTWHFWQVDRGDVLPFGPPQLMMSFTEDGQINDDLVAARDEELGVKTADRRVARVGLEYPEHMAEGADHWQGGKAWQTSMTQVDFRHRDAALKAEKYDKKEA